MPAHCNPSYRSLRLAALACMTCLGLQAPAHSQMPAMQQAGPLQYRCGGIGKDESTAMRAAMKDYPLSLLFAGKDGEYLADLKVDIQSAQGSHHFTASGPVCLIQLPAGPYKVTVTPQEGASKSQTVQIHSGGHTLDFRF